MMIKDLNFQEFEEEIEMIPMLSIDEDDEFNKEEIPDNLPILPLRNNVLFPGVVIPISVGREKSIKAIKKAYKAQKIIGVLAQKDMQVEEPESDDLYPIGTLARVLKILKMPGGGNTIIIQGISRFQLETITVSEPYLEGKIIHLEEEDVIEKQESKAFIVTMKELASKIIELSPQIPNESKIVLNNINRIKFLTHFIASNLNVDTIQKQEILEINEIKKRVQKVLEHLNNELQLLELKVSIQDKVRQDIDKQQRDYFLHQQIKSIQEELGGDSMTQEINRLKEKSKQKKWSKTIQEAFDKELTKLQRINPAAAEYSVILNWLDTLVELPWDEITIDNFNLKNANRILETEHYGLDKVKNRILEYLAVLKLKGDLKSPILCFVGPPGVGKTSLGKSISKALGRQYIRMSLGGVHDESEIRGHRKTYIGAMPGRIIQNLKKVQSSNPVFVLDEIDKIGADHRGDPSSALLEVLDPEQNNTFYDNFLELDYDLSKVMFIATANSLNTIPSALRDRMEIIYINGYSIEEKTEIAIKHLIDKQKTAHGLKKDQVKIGKKTIQKLIEDYTRESGVRELDRNIASIMRYIAKNVAMEEEYNPTILETDLEKILGKPKYNSDEYTSNLPVGVSIGLAWTSVGGTILFIESSLSKGKGGITTTGNLGNVMKESITTAHTWIKSNMDRLEIPIEAFNEWSLHLHLPEGATPKDGPSAGIAMITAMTSIYTQRKIKPYIAMSGEITLRGAVLPVGGIKEKVLAAKRAGLKEIILCHENQRDIEEINSDFLKGLKFHYVKTVNEVLELALEKDTIKNPIQFKSVDSIKIKN
ncbi:MAG: endopeptidase La [Chitinophagales bacterium]|nr:endopeptidase La [Chitinophagales bacterium]MCZ2393747.1 endopeptidase La [Chitinophagales bacterium]